MSKVIFFNLPAPAYGHIHPTIALVKELISRGEEVIYYLCDEFKEKIESTGAQFRDYCLDYKSLLKNAMGKPGLIPLILVNQGFDMGFV